MVDGFGIKEVPRVPEKAESTTILSQDDPKAGYGDIINAAYMHRVKMGEGFCLTSFILGILAVVVSMFSYVYSYGSGGGIFVIQSVIFSLSAMGLGIMGTKMQRMVTNKFGLGIAGALLGLVAILTTVLTVALGGLFYHGYYDTLAGVLL